MPTFDTPEPISVTVELGVGDIRIVASDRTDTIVEVRPSDAAKKSDVSAAEQTRVEYAGGRLLVKAARGWRQWTFRGGRESVDLQIELPAGSHVRAETGIANVRGTGRLGECRCETGIGDIQFEQAGPARIKAGMGDIVVDRALGHAELTTGSGAVQIGSIDGGAVIKNSNGDIWIGEVTGDLRANGANGKISVGQAHAAVEAKTANGDVRLGEVGRLDVGVRDGVAAWLELSTQFGDVDNGLEAAARPEPGQDTVEVRARSSFRQYGGPAGCNAKVVGTPA